MTRLRTGWLSVVLAILLLAACAPPAPAGAPTSLPAPKPTGAPTIAPAKPATAPPARPAAQPTAVPTSAPAPKPAASPAAAAKPAASPAAAFPATIEHKFGRTTIPQEPSRVVTVGYSEQDPVLALGIKPVGVREWFGEQPYATFPWAKAALGDAKPAVLKMPFGQLDFEAIAALKPDLIVATHSGIKQEEYARLAQIAPTVAQPDAYPDFGVPWQEQTRIIGRALGRQERAERLITEAEAKIAAVRKERPEFTGRTVAMAATTATAGQYFLYSPEVPPLRVLSALGFQSPAAIAQAVGTTPNGVSISGEQLRLLDVDVVIWYVASPEQRAAIESDSLYGQLRVGREGRSIFLTRLTGPGTGTLTTAQLVQSAFSFSTVLSVPFAVDLFQPMLVAALDGDPSTKPDTQPTATPATAPAATPAAPPAMATATNSGASAFPRTIQHHMGATTIPTRPQRIVAVTDWFELDNLLALGVRPVLYGYTNRYGTGVSPWATAAGAADLQRYDVGQEVDFERIAAARPDLIFIEWFRGEKAYQRLSEIAPTIVLPKAGADATGWRLAQRTVGQALGLEEAAEQAITETEQVLADQAKRLAPYASRGVTIAYGIYGGSNWFADSTTGPSGRLLNDLGLQLAAIGKDDNAAISVEQINLLNDADILISYDTGPASLAAWESNALLRSLPAVREGRYVVVSPATLRAVFSPTTLSVRWAAPGLADAVIQAAEGRGKKLS